MRGLLSELIYACASKKCVNNLFYPPFCKLATQMCIFCVHKMQLGVHCVLVKILAHSPVFSACIAMCIASYVATNSQIIFIYI